MKRIYALMIVMLVVFTSCREDDGYKDFEPQKTSAYEVSGQWIVDYTYQGAVIGAHHRLDIYNTAADDGSAWVEDHDHFLDFKTRVSTDGPTFSVTNGFDAVNDPDMMTIPDGLVIDGDSINFTLIFIYDDGSASDTVGVAGHLYHGFE